MLISQGVDAKIAKHVTSMARAPPKMISRPKISITELTMQKHFSRHIAKFASKNGLSKDFKKSLVGSKSLIKGKSVSKKIHKTIKIDSLIDNIEMTKIKKGSRRSLTPDKKDQ